MEYFDIHTDPDYVEEYEECAQEIYNALLKVAEKIADR